MALDKTGNICDILNVCRLCLCNDGTKFNLFNDRESNNSLFYSDIIYVCTSIKLNLEDNLPTAICCKCAAKTKELLEFRTLCEKSDYKLREILAQTAPTINVDSLNIKSETASDETNKNNDIGVCKEKCFPVDCNSQGTIIQDLKNKVVKKEENNDNTRDSDKVLPGKCKVRCDRNKHVCDRCKKTFTVKRSLKVHIERMHGTGSTYECDECGRSFNAKSNLVRHKLIHTGEKPHRCVECPAAFIQNAQLQDHIRRHHTFEKPYPCTECGKQFITSYELKRHLESHVKCVADIINDTKAICGTCNEEFTSVAKLKRHKIVHMPNLYLCCECGKRLTTKRGLQSHQELHKNKIIKCDTCQKTFATKRQLAVHVVQCHGPKKYLCNTCGKKYSTKHGLNLHMTVHSDDRPFVCNVEGCDKTFRFKSSLKFHNLSHTREKKYSCTECDKTFAQSGHLYYHKRYHSGLRPYKCAVCSKRFAVKCNFNAHIRRHTGDKNFFCSVCKQAFYDSSSLWKHKKKMHT